MKHFRIVNFERFQHYKDRRPPWIKLYADVLEDYEFGCLQDASKLHLVLLWLLASRHENRLPWDQKWLAQRIHATAKIDLETLQTAGFIEVIQDGSNALATCSDLATSEIRDQRSDPPEKILIGSSPPDRLQGAGQDDSKTLAKGNGNGEGAPIVARLPLVDGTAFEVDEEQGGVWATQYPGIDVRIELGKMEAWLDANPNNRKTRQGVKRFCVNWLAREQNRARPNR